MYKVKQRRWPGDCPCLSCRYTWCYETKPICAGLWCRKRQSCGVRPFEYSFFWVR